MSCKALDLTDSDFALGIESILEAFKTMSGRL